MDRRNVILAVSGAAAPLLVAAMPRQALAQQASSDKLEPIGAGRHKQMTLLLGAFSKQASELAERQAANPRVKEFAGFEVAEQTTVAQVLTDLQKPPAEPLNDAQRQQIQRLKATADSAFDQQYLQTQMQVHRDLLRVQQEFLAGQPAMNTDAVHIAMLARTIIQMHLTMLADIANAMHG